MVFEVRDGRYGKAVFAARAIPKGTVIMTGWGEVGPVRTQHSMQIDRDAHVVIKTDLELVNHSCEPNCGLFIRRGVPSLELHALRTIEPGEELTTDYASFEDEIIYMNGPCLCGARSCRGRIIGYSGLPPERRAALGKYVAEHLREQEAPVYHAG